MSLHINCEPQQKFRTRLFSIPIVLLMCGWLVSLTSGSSFLMQYVSWSCDTYLRELMVTFLCPLQLTTASTQFGMRRVNLTSSTQLWRWSVSSCRMRTCLVTPTLWARRHSRSPTSKQVSLDQRKDGHQFIVPFCMHSFKFVILYVVWGIDFRIRFVCMYRMGWEKTHNTRTQHCCRQKYTLTDAQMHTHAHIHINTFKSWQTCPMLSFPSFLIMPYFKTFKWAYMLACVCEWMQAC